MYLADGVSIYYCFPDETGSKELFITVHPTEDCTKTPEEQAILIAEMLNKCW